MRESNETKPLSRLPGPLGNILRGGLLVLLGVALGYRLVPKPAPEVIERTKVEYKDKVRVVYKDRVVYKKKVTTKPDGTTIVEDTKTEQKTTDSQKKKEDKKTDTEIAIIPRPRYIFGIQYDPVQVNGQAMVGIRLADLPIYLTAGIIAPKNLGFGIGIAVEIP